MQVLVTGGTGFTGSHLVRRLLERGQKGARPRPCPGLFHDELKEMGAEIRIGSVTDRETVTRAVDGCEVVHHVAAAFRKVNLPKETYWQVNVEGTRQVCEASLAAGVRKLVYCSTQGVHGDVKQIPGNEDSPITPEDYYQLTKYEGEQVVQQAIERGLDATILRPTAIYGPGDPGRFLLIFRSAKQGRFYMFSNGQAYYRSGLCRQSGRTCSSSRHPARGRAAGSTSPPTSTTYTSKTWCECPARRSGSRSRS